MREAGGGVFRVANGNLLEIFDAPQIPILTYRAEIEARHAERLCADLGIPAVEASEVKIRRPVRQPTGLDRIEIIDQEQEDIPVRGVEGRGVLGDIDARMVDAGRPVEHARHLPARIACAVSRDALHGLDEFMVVDAAIVGSGDSTELDTAIFDLQRLDLFGAIRRQAVLEVDAGERCWELTEVGGWRTDQARELTEAPMGRRDRRVRAGQCESEALRVTAVGFHPDRRALHGSGPAALGPSAHGREEVRQGQVTLVGRPRKPFRGHAIDSFAAGHVHSVAIQPIARSVKSIQLDHMVDLPDGCRRPLLQPSTRHGNAVRTLTLPGETSVPQKGRQRPIFGCRGGLFHNRRVGGAALTGL
jgi:hypothetical protein